MGRNQQIAIGVLVASFITPTVGLFTGHFSSEQYLAFLNGPVPMLLGITLGASAVVKGTKSVGAGLGKKGQSDG